MAMFLKLVILIISLLSTNANYTYETKHITVPLDHFSFAKNNTFELRYLINETFWSSAGPIFFYTGNEGDITTFAQNTGFMWEIAPQFEALIVFAEHRYYGASIPFKNVSKLEHLGYLTSTQALADYVYLIDYLQQSKGNSGAKNPVIAFGGSYGGMLAAWLRMKYPGTVVGAIAASAPVLQFQGLVPCGIYNHIVTAVYKIASSRDCTKLIKKSWSVLRQITATDEGKAWLSSNWKLCKPLESNDINTLVDWVADIYGSIAMINYPYPSKFLAPVPAYPVKAACNMLQDFSLDGKPLLLAVKNAFSVFTNYTGQTKCNNINQAAGDAFLDINMWNFQACTELIMPSCADTNDMFEVELWNFTRFAEDCYNTIKYKPSRADLAILEYGAKSALIESSNIVFSNGLLDPWSGGGVLESLSDSVLSILIPSGAHHLDLRAANPADPDGVVQARKFHVNNINKWIHSFYKTN